MQKNFGGSGLLRVLRAFKYSFNGFMATMKSEEAFRQELFLCILLIPGAFFFDVTCMQRLLMISSIFIIIIAELTNSAIEVIVDRISGKIHPLSRKAKDIGSAIVLFAFVNAIMVWGTILLGKC